MRKKRDQHPPRRPMAWANAAQQVVEELTNEADLDSQHLDCTQNALRIEARADGLLVAIYLTSIAGGVALMFTADFNFWVGATIFLALACLAVGLVQTVVHAQILGRIAAHADAIAFDDESAVEQLEQLQVAAGSAASSQRFLLVAGAFLATGGIVAHFWQYAWRAALIALGLKALMSMCDVVRSAVCKLRGRN